MNGPFLRELEGCKRELIAFCRHLLWRKGDLEDALQEVLVQALGAYPRFVPGTNFKRWLFQVAAHTIFNLNRKGRAVPACLPEAPDGGLDPGEELRLEEAYESVLKDPERVLAALQGELRRAVGLLNETERMVLLLRSLGDLKYQEIAELLRIPLGSVMGNLGRARAKLRKALVEYAHEV